MAPTQNSKAARSPSQPSVARSSKSSSESSTADPGGITSDRSARTRRSFLKTTGVATVGLGLAPRVHAAGDDAFRIGLVGCGGRGAGAAVNALRNTAMPNVKLVAVGDAFRKRLDAGLRAIRSKCGDKVAVTEDNEFVGIDCHDAVLAADVDLILLCTPPGFRPWQFEAAVEAGTHVFMEKPVATDAPGVRRVMAANESAKQKGLAVAVGHHLRHEKKHIEVVNRIHDGLIGDLKFLRAYFNSAGVWIRPRQPEQNEMEYQVNNWYYFTWLSGDHIVEQHVHDLDVCDWIMQGHPIEANGMGGREVRQGPDVGEIFDHHFVEFTYPGGVKLFSQSRHIPGCFNSFAEHAHGTKGSADIEGHGRSMLTVNGQDPLVWKRDKDGHQTEMDDLFTALAAGSTYNEGDFGASSTMTAILGRMATYSGKVVTWDEALQSDLDLAPERMSWDAAPKSQPRADGTYACAIPGATSAW